MERFLVVGEFDCERLGLAACEFANIPAACAVDDRTERVQFLQFPGQSDTLLIWKYNLVSQLVEDTLKRRPFPKKQPPPFSLCGLSELLTCFLLPLWSFFPT